MKYTQRFIVEDTDYGTGERDPIFMDGRWYAPVGYAFFCPQCVTLWASAVIAGQRTMVLTALCHRHPWTILDTPGSLLHPLDKAFNAAFPDGLIIRENLLWIDNDDYFNKHFASERSTSTAVVPDSLRAEDPPDGRHGHGEDARAANLS